MKSKHLSLFPHILLALLIIGSTSLMQSCEKEVYNNFGFDTNFGSNSSGLTLMDVTYRADSIRLNGSITVSTGELSVALIDPDGYIVYAMNFYAPGTYNVNQTFKASRGVWKMKYISLEGSGSINVHAIF